MADDKAGDTPAQEPPKADTQNEPANYEQRYKDLQSEYTKTKQEIKRVTGEHARDKELLDSVTPYIDWNKANGAKEEPGADDDGYVSKKEIDSKFKKLEQAQEIARVTMDFRRKHPDMVEYEDQVGFYLQNKTDPRHKMSDRIEKAVEYTKNFLETERGKGVSSAKEKKDMTTKKEAEVSGLKEQKQPESKTPDSEGETYDEYIADRIAQKQKGMQTAY